MTLSILALVFGFGGLIWSADKFSDNGAKLGNIFNIPPIIIGLIVFGFGTSAPEMLVSVFAAINDNNGIAIGNAIGSNIFNITLVLALSAIIAKVPFESKTLKREYLFLLFLTFILGFILFDNYLSTIDGLILLTMFTLFLYLLIKTTKTELSSEVAVNKVSLSKTKVWLMLIVSLIVLLISAKLVVFGSVNIAKSLGISNLIIGLTIVSLGTSLPELALAIASTIKKQHQMLIGNILGSNIFNSTIVLSVVALINPGAIKQEVFNRDYIFVLIATLLIFALSFHKNGKHNISRYGGIILLLVLVYYLYKLV